MVWWSSSLLANPKVWGFKSRSSLSVLFFVFINNCVCRSKQFYWERSTYLFVKLFYCITKKEMQMLNFSKKTVVSQWQLNIGQKYLRNQIQSTFWLLNTVKMPIWFFQNTWIRSLLSRLSTLFIPNKDLNRFLLSMFISSISSLAWRTWSAEVQINYLQIWKTRGPMIKQLFKYKAQVKPKPQWSINT